MPPTVPPAPCAPADPPASADPGARPAWRRIRLDVLARVERLPSLSSVVAEFLELSRRDCFSARDFETVLAKDQALVARLLKLANSGMYGARQVASIPEAVVLVGLEQMKRLVFSVSAAGLLRRTLACYDYARPHGFWLHATGVGLAARSIARAAKRSPLRPDEAFVAGLLHDVGKLIIDDFLDRTPGPRPVSASEEVAAVGLDHAELGELILTQWNLPADVVAAVRHHRPAAGARAGVAPTAAAVRLAEVLCVAWGVGRTAPADLGAEVDLGAHADLLRQLELPAEKAPQVVWEIRQALARADVAIGPGDESVPGEV